MFINCRTSEAGPYRHESGTQTLSLQPKHINIMLFHNEGFSKCWFQVDMTQHDHLSFPELIVKSNFNLTSRCKVTWLEGWTSKKNDTYSDNCEVKRVPEVNTSLLRTLLTRCCSIIFHKLNKPCSKENCSIPQVSCYLRRNSIIHWHTFLLWFISCSGFTFTWSREFEAD